MITSALKDILHHYKESLSLQALLIDLKISDHPIHSTNKLKNDGVITLAQKWLIEHGINEENAIFCVLGSYQFGAAIQHGEHKSDLEGIVFLKDETLAHKKVEIFTGLRNFLADTVRSDIGIYDQLDLQSTELVLQDAERIGDILANFFGGKIIFGSIPEDYMQFLPEEDEHISEIAESLHQFSLYRRGIVSGYLARLDAELQHGNEIK